MINLERRPDRRVMMEKALAELGIEYKYVAAVDGRLVLIHCALYVWVNLLSLL